MMLLQKYIYLYIKKIQESFNICIYYRKNVKNMSQLLDIDR